MAQWAPAVDDVARLVPTRAVTSLGRQPSFTDDTVPSSDQVEDLVVQAVGDVVASVGSFDPDAVINPADVIRGQEAVTLGDLARTAASLDAAALVEMTFFADQISEGRSSYDQLDERYRLALARLIEAVTEVASGGVGAGPAIPPPMFSFPDIPADVFG